MFLKHKNKYYLLKMFLGCDLMLSVARTYNGAH